MVQRANTQSCRMARARRRMTPRSPVVTAVAHCTGPRVFVQQAFTLLFVPHAFWAKYYAAMGPPPGTLQPRPGFIDQTRLSVWPRVCLTLFTHEANQGTPTGWVCPPSATCYRRWSGHADADAPRATPPRRTAAGQRDRVEPDASHALVRLRALASAGSSRHSGQIRGHRIAPLAWVQVA